MIRLKLIAVILILLSFACDAFAQRDGIERRIDSLLRIMTLEEKCGQLNQPAADWTGKEPLTLKDGQKELLRKGLVGSFLNASGATTVKEIQRIAVEETRLHIPVLFGLDVIHGYRTIFPVPIGMASSWDPSLVEKAARIAAEEASSAGIHWTFAPMVDIARDPRWGRIVEGSGEDPVLGSAMAAAAVRGFQGTSLSDPSSILACAKHFAAYGGAEAGRDYNTVDMSERTLRDVYLKPYAAAVAAGAGTLMSSFNEISGIPSSGNRWLMTDLLRGEWGFRGFVVSDWTAIEEMRKHGVAGSRGEAGALAINAGVDMDMVSDIYRTELPALVRAGKVKESVVDESVRRVLRMKFMLGLFDNPYRGTDPKREERSMLTPAHLNAAREIARKSVVLLKNDRQLLPLSKSIKTVAVIGPLAGDSSNVLGAWHTSGRREDVVTLLQGIRNAVGKTTTVLSSRGCGIDDSTSDFSDAVAAARRSDAAIVVLGESEEMSGEASSRGEIGLPGVQENLLREIVGTGTPTVLVLMNGRPLTITWAAAHVPAILEAWFPGTETGNAVPDIIFGDENPSGKLPVTFPRSVGQIPLYYNHKNSGRPYDEQDKYTSKYLDLPNTPLFPFGFGLSYTTFSYSAPSVNKPVIGMSDSLLASVRVRNTGPKAGEEIVQLYVRDEVASVTRPVKELKGFRRVPLKPGEEQTVGFVIRPADLAFTGIDMKQVVEPGMFKVYIGGCSTDTVATEFELK